MIDRLRNLHKIEWKLNNMQVVKQIDNIHDSDIKDIVAHGDRFATYSFGGTAKLWDSSSLSVIHTFNCCTESILDLDFDGNYLVISCQNHLKFTIQVYDINTGKHLRTIASHNQPISFLAILRESSVIVSYSYQTIQLRTLPSANAIAKYHVNMGTARNGVLLSSGKVALISEFYERKNIINVFELPYLRDGNTNAQKRPYTMELAFAAILADSSILTLPFIIETVRPENVLTASDPYHGHNIVLLAISCK